MMNEPNTDTRVVPDTDNFSVAALAVAWEIVKKSNFISSLSGTNDQKIAPLTDALIKSYSAILSARDGSEQS